MAHAKNGEPIRVDRRVRLEVTAEEEEEEEVDAGVEECEHAQGTA